MSDELKPCPFCGGEGTWKASGRGWAVHCEGRFGSCLMNARTHYQPTKDQAITAWNTRATPKVKPLDWHKSHIKGWNEDWHTTTPIIYTVRCADENGWKWSFHGGQGYCCSPEAAKAAAQADYERRILEALE